MADFESDLERWVRRELLRRNRSLELLRLLRPRVRPLLPPTTPGIALPSDIRTASRPEALLPVIILPSAAWLCWPAADEAIYGWGEPYGPNPPLGTIQLSFSDTARIAREISATDVVVHGVNKIAGHRDWRSGDLVVTWTPDGVYSNGVEIVAGQSIIAAGVQDPTGTPWLIWTNTHDRRIRRQQCTIENDRVTSVFGVEEFCTHSFNSEYWSEFSQDGSKLLINDGLHVGASAAFELIMPAAFTGQSISATEVADSESAILNFVNFNEYDGEQRFHVKSQYKDNTVVSAFLKIKISNSVELNNVDFVNFDEVTTPGEIYICADCPEADAFAVEAASSNSGYQRRLELEEFKVSAQLDMNGVLLPEYMLRDDLYDSDLWCIVPFDGGQCGSGGPSLWDAFPYGLGGEPLWPPPPGLAAWPSVFIEFPQPGDPLPGCYLAQRVEVTATRYDIEKYYVIAQGFIDLRHDRAIIFNLGEADIDAQTQNRRLELSLYRGGAQADVLQYAGDYGLIGIPERLDIINQNDLLNQLTFTGNAVIEYDQFGVGAAIDLSLSRTAFYFRLLNISNGQYTHVNYLEGANIENLLSIAGKDGARIGNTDVLHRLIGLL